MLNRTQLVVGILLIFAGIVFFLDAADVVSAGELIGDWWPAAFILVGLFALFGGTASRTAGVLLAIFGAVLLLATTGVIDVPIWQLIVAVLLIVAGLRLILRGVQGNRRTALQDDASMTVILGEENIASESRRFTGANLTIIMGEMNLDLRNATLDLDGATVDTFCLLGELKIAVPREWRVSVDGMPLLGEFNDDTDRAFERAGDAPRLRVTGTALLGEVNVRHHT